MAREEVFIEDSLHARPVLSLAGEGEAYRGAEHPSGWEEGFQEQKMVQKAGRT